MSSFVEMSDPEHRSQVLEEQTEITRIATAIRAWQDRSSPRVSNEEMVRLYPGLGSPKTFNKLVRGEYDSLILANHLPKYAAVLAQIEELTGSHGREEIYPDLTPTFECRQAAASLVPQRGKTRLMLIEGPTGAGKTAALESIAAKYIGQTILVEADETWKSPSHMLGEMLVAAGVFRDIHDDKMPISQGGRLECLIAHLRGGRKILGIDEGHHLSAAGLNIIKSLLNKTDSVIIIACIDTLWRKLAAKNWEEAKQLVFNRLFERVRLVAPTSEDIELFLSRRVPALAGIEWGRAVGPICTAAASYGYFAFARRLANKLNAYRLELTSAVIVEHVEALKKGLQTR